MQSTRWKKSRIVTIGVISLLAYLMLKPRKYEHTMEILLLGVKPSTVWEYVADFSNMKNMNPTIQDFEILSESGVYNNWKYRVKYSETLSHWPYTFNEGVADFHITVDSPKHLYFVNSTHTTCFMYGAYCLNSFSSFYFTNGNKTISSVDTLGVEEVVYECPAAFKLFCRREVEHQRKLIKGNLKLYFKPVKHL